MNFNEANPCPAACDPVFVEVSISLIETIISSV